MKKGLIFLKLFAVITLSLLLLDIFPYVYLKTENNNVITKNFYVENSVKETANEDAVIATINYDEIIVSKVQENGNKLSKVKVEATKKVVKEQSKVSKTVEQPKPEVKQESVESKFNLGTITISNSDFKRNVIMDDGSYYYLNHDLNGKYNGVGMPIIDSRTNFKTRKTIIYAHSAKSGNSPFNYLQNYHENESFFRNHRYITITYEGHTYKYEIFSVYVSLADDDYSEGLEYFRVMGYSDSEWDERIKWYKSNSDYDTGVSVSGNDKILIFQTCSMDSRYYQKYYRANLVVMAKLIEG